MIKKNKWMVNQYSWTSTKAPIMFSLQSLKSNCHLQVKRFAISYLSIGLKKDESWLERFNIRNRYFQMITKQLSSSYSSFGAASFQFTQLWNRHWNLSCFRYILHNKKIFAQQRDTSSSAILLTTLLWH